MMAMSGTVKTVSFSAHRRYPTRVDGPLQPESPLPGWVVLQPPVECQQDEVVRVLTHLDLLRRHGALRPSPHLPFLLSGRFSNGQLVRSNPRKFLNNAARDAGVKPLRMRAT
jgi:hypothetical protein